MKIWISTSGCRMTGTYIRLILAGALLLPAGATGDLAKEKGKGKPPDMEMLEFLGIFETTDGKMIDPLKLPARSQEEKASTGTERKKDISKKAARKKKGESND